jgi:hypothetical protein
MGDSITDEYAEQSYGYARNWLEQLTLFRAIETGPTAAEAGEPGGTWGEPRRTGYEYNWARYASTSTMLLTDGQHTGLAAGVASEGISHVVLAIGSNDFSPSGTAYFAIYNGLWTPQQIAEYVEQTVVNIETAMTTVLATGADVAIVDVLDLGVVPAVWGNPAYSDPDRRELVTAVIRELNYRLVDLARNNEVALVELSDYAVAIFGPNHDPQQFLLLGNVTIDLQAADTPSNSNPTAGFVHDGIHPHTHLQGTVANLILEALRAGYDVPTASFTEEEILAHAGIAYGGQDTLAAQIGEYRDYVLNFAVPGDLDSDGAVGTTDFEMMIAAWGPCPDAPEPCAADLDGDAIVGILDFLMLLANWE